MPRRSSIGEIETVQVKVKQEEEEMARKDPIMIQDEFQQEPVKIVNHAKPKNGMNRQLTQQRFKTEAADEDIRAKQPQFEAKQTTVHEEKPPAVLEEVKQPQFDKQKTPPEQKIEQTIKR